MRTTLPAILSRRKWTILTTVLAAVVTVALGAAYRPRTYTAQLMLQVLPYGANSASSSQAYYAAQVTNSYIALSESNLVLDKVKERLGLDTLPEFELEPVPGTDLLELSVIDEDPETAKQVADTIAAILVNQEQDAYVPIGVLAKSRLEDQVSQLEVELEALDEQYWDLVSQVNVSTAELTELSRTIDEKQRFYDALLNQYGQASVSNVMQSNMLSVVQPAIIQPDPIFSIHRMPVRILLALVSGLIGGVALAITLEHTDRRLFSGKEAEAALGLPITGRVPQLDWNERGTLINKQSKRFETFRLLRTRIFTQRQLEEPQTLLLTSAMPGEGKSTVIANLALAIAETERNVLVIDADMRRPTQHKLLDLPNNVGLSSVLTGAALLDEAVQETGNPYMFALTSGPIPDNPAELLSQTDRITEMLNRLHTIYPIILIDTPPSIAATDAAILSHLVSRVYIVVRLSQSEESAVTEVRRLFNAIHVDLSGAIVNLANRDPSYSKRYNYDYKYQ